MKTPIVSACLLSFVTFFSHAQLFRQTTEYELTLGALGSRFRGVAFENSAIKMGYHFGLGAQWKAGSNWAVLSRISIEQKGFTTKPIDVFYGEPDQQQVGQLKSSTKLTYVSIPISVGYPIGRKRQLLPEIGPYMSYLIKAQDISDYSWRGKDIYSRLGEYQRIDVGLTMGIRLRTTLSNSWSIAARLAFQFGLTKISTELTSAGFQGAKNESLLIGISLIKKAK